MAFASFKLENLPRRIQLAIIAVLALAIVAIVYMFYLKNLVTQRSKLQTEIAQLEAAVAQAASVENQLSQFKRELAMLDARLVELRRILPSQKETPDVLRNVQQMAGESNLKIVKFVPQPVASRGFYSDWPIRMELQGSYNALGTFFEKIGLFTRIVNIDNISLKGIERSTDSSRTLNSICTATTFVFQEEQAGSPDENPVPAKGTVPGKSKVPVKGKTPVKGAVAGKGTVTVN
jgi:type IV pilus assembly protein PilO